MILDKSNHGQPHPEDWIGETYMIFVNEMRDMAALNGLLTKILSKAVTHQNVDGNLRLAINPEYSELIVDESIKGFVFNEALSQMSFVTMMLLSKLWSDLEYFVLRFVGNWLFHNQQILMLPIYENMKVSFRGRRIPIRNLPTPIDQDDCVTVVESMNSTYRFKSMHGGERLVKLASITGLLIECPSELHDLLVELEQLRHAIIHRNRFADHRLEDISRAYTDNPDLLLHSERFPILFQAAADFAILLRKCVYTQFPQQK